MEDEIFGDTLIYCRQHCRPHSTGWCSVSNRDKIGLGTNDTKEALQKCRDWGLYLIGDPVDKLSPNAPALLAACKAAVENCEMCDRTGTVESYPAYGAGAFDGAGNPIINYDPCPCCTLARAAIAQAEGVE